MFKQLFNQQTQTDTIPRIQNINVVDLKKRLDAGENLFLLDVRSSMEYQYDGHISGSRLLPLNALRGRISELPADQPIVCICRSGNRSRFACEELAAAGFENVINLSGGMMGWQMAGYPVQ